MKKIELRDILQDNNDLEFRRIFIENKNIFGKLCNIVNTDEEIIENLKQLQLTNFYYFMVLMDTEKFDNELLEIVLDDIIEYKKDLDVNPLATFEDFLFDLDTEYIELKQVAMELETINPTEIGSEDEFKNLIQKYTGWCLEILALTEYQLNKYGSSFIDNDSEKKEEL